MLVFYCLSVSPVGGRKRPVPCFPGVGRGAAVLWVCVSGLRENSLEAPCFPWGLVVHKSSPAVLQGARESVRFLSQVCQTVFLRVNTLHSVSYSLSAFLLASLCLGLSVWILKRLFWKSGKMSIVSFPFRPVSTQILLKTIWATVFG